MKIYVNRTPINGPWGGGNAWVKAFHRHVPELGHELVPPSSMSVAPDVIMLAGLDNDNQGGIAAEQAIMYKVYQDRVKLVLRVNENDARKGTHHMDDYLLKLAPHIDGTVFVSKWLRDYFMERGWPCQNNTVIVNGVDKEVFRPQPKLDNGKINLLMSHWSDNYMKGQDYAEWLDSFVGKHSDEFTFTFVGRTKANFKHTTLIGPFHGKRLGEEVGKYDVCINASRFDPGPNSVIEPISCNLPTYVHVDGGGGVEFAGSDHTFSSFDDLERLLMGKRFSQNNVSFCSWKECTEAYVNFLAKTLTKENETT